MKRDILDIVKEKEFIELSLNEREGLTNYFTTEDEYNQLKQVLVGVNAMDWTNPVPKTDTKERLDVLFAQTHPKLAPVWYSSTLALVVPKHKPFQRQPLVQIAAVGLLALLTVPFFNSDTELDKTQIAVVENKTEKSEDVATKDADLLKDERITVENEQTDNLNHDVVSSDIGGLPITVSNGIAPSFMATNGAGISPPGSSHPDGVFIGNTEISYSLPASEQPDDLLDLLTSTF
jgi:hypothetical protein